MPQLGSTHRLHPGPGSSPTLLENLVHWWPLVWYNEFSIKVSIRILLRARICQDAFPTGCHDWIAEYEYCSGYITRRNCGNVQDAYYPEKMWLVRHDRCNIERNRWAHAEIAFLDPVRTCQYLFFSDLVEFKPAMYVQGESKRKNIHALTNEVLNMASHMSPVENDVDLMTQSTWLTNSELWALEWIPSESSGWDLSKHSCVKKGSRGCCLWKGTR